MLRYIPSIPSFFRALIMKECWTIQVLFPTSIEMVIGFLSLILFMYCITFIDFYMLNHPCIPEWNQFDNGVQSYKCVVEFIFKYFLENFCAYVHQGNCSIIFYFFYCALIGFWYTSFIEWVCSIPSISILWNSSKKLLLALL
jgi:hypothetical protein